MAAVARPVRTPFEEQLLAQFAERQFLNALGTQLQEKFLGSVLPQVRSQALATEEAETASEESSPPSEDQLLARAGELDRKPVEIQGVEGRLRPIGEKFLVEANGLRGLAEWDGEQEVYLVHTYRDFSVRVQETRLREAEALSSEAGGFDLAWPMSSSWTGKETFAQAALEVLQSKGHCLVRMHDSEDSLDVLADVARQRHSYKCLRLESEGELLGYCAEAEVNKILWLRNQAPEVQGSIANVADAVGAATTPPLLPCGVLLRLPLTGSDQDVDLSMERRPMDEQDFEDGLVESHLDFIQRRQICLIRPLSGEGCAVELFPKGLPLVDGQEAQAATLQLPRGRLLMFRHDLLDFRISEAGQDTVILQSWLLEQPQRLLLDGIEGGRQGMGAVFGDPPQRANMQVHIMSCMCRFPGSTRHLDRFMSGFLGGIDKHVRVPLSRFDIGDYFDPDGGQFSNEGKTIIQHSAFLLDEELRGFDNSFFGIPERTAALLAPSQRMSLEVSFEGLAMAGCTRKSLRGSPLMIVVGEGVSGLDWDWAPGLRKDPEAWLEANAHLGISTANRMAFSFGTKGPTMQVDCACSSELVAASFVHTTLRKRDDDELKMGMAMAGQAILTPGPYVGGSMAGLHGDLGRCATFNATANGFVRGEGSCGLVMSVRDDPEVVQERLASYLSSFVNQDGRSATLTAPNGMSQAICISSSMKEAGLEPSDICLSETHGTATAIGDPIEVGSLVRAFMGHSRAIAVTAGKSNVGHTEPVAGGYSLLRTIVSMTTACIPPNVHFRVLSKNIASFSFAGGSFNGFFPSESCDHTVTDYPIGGITSFGYGGTNCRSEIWAPGRRARDIPSGMQVRDPITLANRGLRGLRIDRFSSTSSKFPRALRGLDCITVACPSCLGPMCWLCGAAVPGSRLGSKHYCSTVRVEGASYEYCSDCYLGSYSLGTVVGEPLDPDCSMLLTSTATAWKPEEMDEISPGIFVGLLVLGETRREHFHFLLQREKQKTLALFPVSSGADSSARILGPDENLDAAHWVLDGRVEGASAGAVFQIRLEWGTARKTLTWKAIEVGEYQRAMLTSQEHSYSVVREGGNWLSEPMQHSRQEPDFWEWTGRIPSSGRDLLRFQRDGDSRQLIYPSHVDFESDVLGPDEDCEGRAWPVGGEEGDMVTARLRVVDGSVTVVLRTSRDGRRVWQNAQRPAEESYSVIGTWSGGRQEPLQRDVDNRELHRLRFRMGASGRGEFQIVTSGRCSTRMHPAVDHARPGSAVVCCSENPNGLRWQVVGPPGQTMEVRLDLGAEDREQVVTCGLVL